MSKASKIQQLVLSGKSVSEIAKITKTSRQYVYVIRNRMKKSGIDKLPKLSRAPKAIGIAGLSNRPKSIRGTDEPVVDAPKESFWRKLWRIVWK